MREYLFRGKRCNNLWMTEDSWTYGSLIHAGEFCCILDPDDENDMDYPYLDGDLGIIDGNVTPVVPETVGQFTGKYDKNGRRIFEGDIVRGMMDYGPAGLLESIMDIRFNENLASYQWEYFEMSTLEVIGNIYDNSELLKKRGLV